MDEPELIPHPDGSGELLTREAYDAWLARYYPPDPPPPA
jgi:hypothetical protein